METLRVLLAWPVLAAVMIFVIWQFLKWLHRIQRRIEKVEFEHDIVLLKMSIECSELNEQSFRFIAGQFNDMEIYDKDERMDKLREDFEYKFREYLEPKVILN